ncbi:ABC-F family ATP-binding cassette domain-containing protein [Hydrogenovibrio kuenenii]|uniref:ABC-F family ATP-binding cassette domain-containing protein n=1 Tax=Hydrogenovibrio kuenenii TaxID=63658 RepID=UPI000465D6E3|nr:ATP-binding cassette domain-containing protein [Hydrogenovibrio kuenenii]
MLSIQSIDLMAGKQLLLQGASLTIHPGQKIGLIGQNGAGKSTLLKAILGEVSLDAGSINMPQSWLIGCVQQELATTDVSALDFVVSGDELFAEVQRDIMQAEKDNQQARLVAAYDRLDHISGYLVPQKAKQLLFGLGFEEDAFTKSLSQFSGGWQVRLKLARALMQRSDLLLLDEPTNHLDIEAVSWLVQWLKSYEGAVIVISHDRFFLDEVVSGIAQIEQQKIHFFTGNFESFERQKNAQLMQQQALHETQKLKMQQLKSFISRFKAKASKAKQAQSRVKALERMEEVAAVQAMNPFKFTLFQPVHLPDPMLRVESLDFGYDKPIIENASLVLRAGDRIGLVGVNGSGKSTLLKLLIHDLSPQKGKVIHAKGLKIGYFAQHQLESLTLDWSPLNHLVQLDKTIQENDGVPITDQEARSFLGRFGFTNEKALETVKHFSGGEKARLSLALMVFQKPNLIVLDEPTNHLDMETRDALDMALQEFSGALILVTHDRHLLSSIADQYWWVHAGQVEAYFGSLDEYLNQRLQWIKTQKADEQESKLGDQGNTKKEKRQAGAQIRKRIQQATRTQSSRLKQVEKLLEQTQTEIQQLHLQLEDSALYQTENSDKLTEILKKEAEGKRLLESLEEEWLMLEEEIAVITEQLSEEDS